MQPLTPEDNIFFKPFNTPSEEQLKNMVPNPIAPRSGGDIYPTRVKGSDERIRKLNEECDKIMKKIDRSFLEY